METFCEAAYKIIADKRYLLLLSFLIVAKFGFGQTKPIDSTAYYINKLNWKSFGITSNYVSQPYLLEDAKKIISINDKNKVKKLIKALSNEEKTVVIHMILTQ